VTNALDWPQAFSQKKATLIAGTGFQYGDTDFVKYSTQLYVNFSQQLHAGTGPVTVGRALVLAKQSYLAETPDMSGIHQKAVLEATLYGLPMIGVDLPGRAAPPSLPPAVTGTTAVTTNPGLTLGLTTADITIHSSLTPQTVDLRNLSAGTT